METRAVERRRGDVLGPTSSDWKRPYEYEVDWDTFLKAWGAQKFDGLAVAPLQ